MTPINAAATGPAVSGATFLGIPAAGWSAVAMLFGGLSPLIATGLIAATGVSLAPAIYATAVVVIAGVPVLLFMRDLAGRSLAEVDRTPDADAVPVG